MRKFSINEFIADPENNSDEFFGFYDWFCNEKALKAKALTFVPKLKFLVKEGILDGNKLYVWFKNNCPMNGSLYDDMRISSLDNENKFLGGFCPKTGHNNVELKTSIWYLYPDFKELEFKSWSDFKNKVKNDLEFKSMLIEKFKV
jgi:hypothetical protein